jgi:hypothetical protein
LLLLLLLLPLVVVDLCRYYSTQIDEMPMNVAELI